MWNTCLIQLPEVPVLCCSLVIMHSSVWRNCSFTCRLGDVWSRRHWCRRLAHSIFSYTADGTEDSLPFSLASSYHTNVSNLSCFSYCPSRRLPLSNYIYLCLCLRKERIFIWKSAIECLECCSWAHILQKNLLNVAPKEYTRGVQQYTGVVDGTYGSQSLHFTCFLLSFFLFSLYHMMALCNVCFTIACFRRFLRAKIAKKCTHFLCFRRINVHMFVWCHFVHFILHYTIWSCYFYICCISEQVQ